MGVSTIRAGKMSGLAQKYIYYEHLSPDNVRSRVLGFSFIGSTYSISPAA